MKDDSIFDTDSDYEDLVKDPSEWRTENGALTLGTTKDPRVDLFYKTVRGLDEIKLKEYLQNSWSVNPQDTLRLIFFIRDIRGKGKGEKKLFYQCFKFLIDNHSEAVRRSAKHIPFYGSYKDWLEIFLCTRYEKSMLKEFAKQLQTDLDTVKSIFHDETINVDEKVKTKKKRKGFFSYIWWYSSDKTQKDKTQNDKTQKDKTQNEKVNISLAWKWAPTENTHYDKGKYNGTVSKLAEILGMTKKEYRKSCSLMRAHLGVVEGLMCSKKWEEIDFSKVPSRAMHIYKKAYAKHQPERFEQYLNDIINGKTTMNTSVLHPHEIVGQYINIDGSINTEQSLDVEAQWISFIEKLEKDGVTFDQSIGVIDTSGSMSQNDGGMPAKVAYSIGLILSDLCKGPFHNKWIEFSENAKFHKFPDSSLHDKLKSIKSINQSTNIQSVFDLIFNVYDMFDVPTEHQIKRIFVITDGQWNNQTSNSDLTNFQLIDMRYKEAGYKIPQLIFWNVRGNTIDFPIDNNTQNTTLVSGFSTDLLKLFLKGVDLNPLNFVLEAINDIRYERIKL